MKKLMCTICLFAVLSITAQAFADTDAQLKELVTAHLALSTVEDIEGIMNTMHSQSPTYASQKDKLEEIAKVYNFDFDLLSFSFIGEDQDYAYARFKFLLKEVSGFQFKDNERDTLGIFKKEGEQWKFWSQINLEIDYK